MSARILLIEDNPENLELMTYLLQALGHIPLVARDGHEGLAAARREKPDLLICDIQLPGLDGYEIARQLKIDPELGSIPRVAVTAMAMMGDRDRVMTAGFSGYIAKPIDPETFVGQIDSFLRPDQRAREPRRDAAAPAAVAQGATILVVDDSQSNLDVFISLLVPLAYRVVSAGTVAEGLVQARSAAPDLIISDMHLARESGRELLQCLQADPQLQSIPFVFISSTMPDPSEREAAVPLGAVRFIVRPIEPETLLAYVEACLRKPEAR